MSIHPNTAFATVSDEKLVAMVAAADRGEIDLTDYWGVGDTRTINLSAMAATGVGESHAAQTAQLVIMNVGGKTLNSAVASGRTTCSFVVGLKDSLKEIGYMNSTGTNAGGWTSSARKTWCNSVFKASLPNALQPIFKAFQNKTSAGSQSSNIVTDVDTWALPSEIEIFGSTTYSFAGEGSQFKYYETAANRIKKVNGSAYPWWGRSPRFNNSNDFCGAYSDGGNNYSIAYGICGLAPFGCI